MEERRFGESDLTCSVLGFGTWEMSTTQYGHIDIAEASAAVNAALDRGITLVDTAEGYGPYHAERILADALGPRIKDIVLVTKVGFTFNDAEEKITGRCSRYDYILERAEGCLKRLRTDCIDLLLVHWPDHNTPYEEPIRALEELKQSGKIRYYGVSNFSPAMMDACESVGHLTANQIGYHLFDRRVEKSILPYCAEHGIGFMAYGTLGFGLLTGALTSETEFVDWDWRSSGNAFGLPLFRRERFLKELEVAERLKAVAARHGKTLPQLAIAWVLGNPAVTVALVGMRNVRELDENIAAADWKLAPEDRAEIDRIFEELGVSTYRDHAQAL